MEEVADIVLPVNIEREPREGVGGGARRGGAEGKELDDMQDACLAPTLQAWVHPSPAVPPD